MPIYSPLLLPLNKTSVSTEPLSNRQDLINISQIDQEVILALTAGIYIICKKNSYPQPSDGKEVLDKICQYAEVGLRE